MAVLVAQWNPFLVALSWTVSFLGSTVTSLLLCQSHAAKRLQGKLLWILMAAVIFGFSSIWSLHFVAMLAQALPVPVTYNAFLTALSAFIAVATTFLAFSANLLTKYYRRRYRKKRQKPFRINSDDHKAMLAKSTLNNASDDPEQVGLLHGEYSPQGDDERDDTSPSVDIVAAQNANFNANIGLSDAAAPTPRSALPSIAIEEDEDVSDDEAARPTMNANPFASDGSGSSEIGGRSQANGFFGSHRPDLRKTNGLSSQSLTSLPDNSRRSSVSGTNSKGHSSSVSTDTSRDDTTDTDLDWTRSSAHSSGFSLGVSHALQRSIKREKQSSKSVYQEIKAKVVYAVTSKIVLGRSAVWALAIWGMHWIGILAMRVEQGYISLSPGLVVLSYVVAFVVCLAASVYVRDMESRLSRQLSFSFLAATGVFAMHFTGASAVTFHSDFPPDWRNKSTPMALVFTIIALSILTCTMSTILLSQVTATSRNRILEAVMTRRRLWRVLAQKEAAEAANALKSDFISVASHEIRTPLHTVSGYSELLARTDLTDEQVLYLTNIRRAVHTIQLITRQVLDFSRMERDAGETEAKPSNINLREVVQGLAEFSEDRPSEAHKVSFMVFIAPEVPKICYIDETYITRILMNLISNALKFTQSGHVLLSVNVAENQLVFDVEDTGIGISPKFQRSLFDPFSQADQSLTRKHTGTGLGLAISRQLAKRLGGVLEVRSKEREGTTFTLKVPLSGDSAPKAVEHTAEPLEAQQPPLLQDFEPERSLSRLKECQRSQVYIYVCEEHPKTRERIIGLWRRLGFNVQSWSAPPEGSLVDLCNADFVWISAGWAQTYHELLPAVLRKEASEESENLVQSKCIVCFAHNEVEDFSISPLLLTATNLLKFKRPIIFHSIADILDAPLENLAEPTRPERVKLVRFASTPGTIGSDTVAEERQRERDAFAEALALRQAQQGMLKAGAVESTDSAESAVRRILLVEDNAVNQRLGARILQKLGFDSHLASHGKEAVDYLLLAKERNSLPHAILMDCQMPIMNGFEATKRIRDLESQGNLPHIPIIALTANVTNESELECLNSGMDAFLPKPLLMADLAAKLKKFVE